MSSTAPSSSSQAAASTILCHYGPHRRRTAPRASPAWWSTRTRQGLSFGAPEKKLGWNASPTAQVIFDDVRVPVANRVGAEGDGFKFAMAGLDGGRLNIGACSLGGAQRCLDEAVAYVKDRSQFGQAIADFQNTQFTLADMATDLEAARALLYLAAAKVTAGAPDKTRFAAMAKKLATRQRQRDRRQGAADVRRLWLSARTIRSSASGATCASTASLKGPTRSCA